MRNVWKIHRRAVLRGAGTAVALPFLEVMTPSRARAADPVDRPIRFLFMGAVQMMSAGGVRGKFDSKQNCMVAPWTPADERALGAQDAADKFLAPFVSKGIISKVTVLTGLSYRWAGHGAGYGAILQPQRAKYDTAKGPDNCGNFGLISPLDMGGPSIDQIAANYLKSYTAIPSVQLGYQPERFSQPIEGYTSWSNARTGLPRQSSAKKAFEQLFGTYDPDEDKAAAAKRKLYRKSVLDAVKADAERLRLRVGRSDGQKLDQYFTSVRELEVNIERAPVFSGNLGTTPTLLGDVLLKAFEIDRTRVATYEVAAPWRGSMDFHTASHWNQGATADDQAERQRLHDDSVAGFLQMYADFLYKMDQIEDPDGSSALDNSIVHTSTDVADGNTHKFCSMPVILGGRGGKAPSGDWAINSGRHVRVSKPWVGSEYLSQRFLDKQLNDGERTLPDLFWMILNLIGVPNLTKLGEATAPLDLS